MNIIQANKHYYLRSGADRYILDLTELLEQHGHTVVPFAMEHGQNLRTPWERSFPGYVQTKTPGISFGALRTVGRGIYSFEARNNMYRLIRESRPDLCHIHNIYAQISPSILDALRDRKVPTVMTVHDYHLIAPNYMLWAHNRIEDWSRVGLLRATWSRFHKDSYVASFAQSLTYKIHHFWKSYQKGIDLFIAPTEFVRKKMIEAGFTADKIRTIPHFIDTKGMTPATASSRHDTLAGVNPNNVAEPFRVPYVLFAGRLVPEKGAEVLIRAMEQLPNIKCKIVGSGPDLPRLREWARNLKNIEFMGWQTNEQLWNLYRGAQAVVVPSLWYEVFGLVALEAMACGTPVIASDIGGLPEVVQDGVTGRLFPPGDVSALCQQISDLIEHPEIADQYGQAGFDRVISEHNPALHYDRIMQAYRDIM
ncbi:MAG: glycosyltransferase family 4 protein [Candidatus Uhrbacteria bacterium]